MVSRQHLWHHLSSLPITFLHLTLLQRLQTTQQIQNQLIGTQLVFPPLSTFPSLNQPLSVKLDENNYLIWKNQLLNVIIANGMEDFIDRSQPSLVHFLDAQMQRVNPDFTI